MECKHRTGLQDTCSDVQLDAEAMTPSPVTFPTSPTSNKNKVVDASSNIWMLHTPREPGTIEVMCQWTELWHHQITINLYPNYGLLRTDLRSSPMAELCCSHHRGPAMLLSWWTADSLLLESTLELTKLGRKKWGDEDN